MSSIVSLPQELIELIVDALALKNIDNPISSLKALSLVCHAFLPHCRKHLFATIRLHDYQTRDRQKAIALLELFRVTPELAHHIRALECYFGSEQTWEDSPMPPVFHKLTKLVTLYLSFSPNTGVPGWNQMLRRFSTLSVLHLPTLTSLTLEGIPWFTLSDLIPCVGLKDLTFKWVTFEDGIVELPTNFPNPMILDRFSIVDQDSKSLQALFRTKRSDEKPIIDLATLKILRVESQCYEDHRAMAEFLGTAQNLIEFCLDCELTYSTRSPPQLDWVYDALVGSLKTLKHLTFLVHGFADEPSRESLVLLLSRELQKMRGQNVVESLKVVVGTSLFTTFGRGEEWSALDHTLSRGWPALKYVSVVVLFNRRAPQKERGLMEALLKLPENHFAGLRTSPAIEFVFEVRDTW